MAGPIDRLRSSLGQLAEPSVALLHRMRDLVGQRMAKRTDAGGVSHTLEDVVRELRALDAKSIAVYADAALRDQVHSASGATCAWVSHRAADLQRGAIDPRSAEVRDADAIVLGGKDLKLAYVHLLRTLQGGRLPRILWVGEGFEFCFSTLPVPADATAAEIYLHNHFDAYFALRDPLLVMIRASDGKTGHESQRIVGPRETMRLTIDELLPARDGAAFVELYTSHPVLTRGRHHRWRLCADVHWGDSFTTLHGAHDEGPDRRSQSRFSTGLLGDGELVVTVPNYELAAPASPITKYVLDTKSTVERSAERPLEEVRYRGASAKGHVGYEYVGHGTSFYYGMREVGGRHVLFGNHESTIAVGGAPVPPLPPDRRAALEALEKRHLLLLPHALPVLDGPIELGFSFASATPTIDRYVVRAYDAAGKVIGQSSLRDPLDGPLFTDELAGKLDLAQSPALFVIAPDWRSLDGDPAKFNMAGELVARDRKTGDFDVTEFQSCWRNLSALVDDFPHWIAPPNGLLSRTRLIGRVVHDGRLRTGVVIVHASGDGSLRGDARAEIHVLEPRGRDHVHELVLPAFTSQLVWLDEVFPDLAKLLPEGYGSLMILSPDRDLNTQLLTHDRAAGAVSLQHLWGY